jgi:hypothetical protein
MAGICPESGQDMQENDQQTQKTLMRDWKQIVEEAIEWSLNAAADAARNHPHDIAAIERVRGYVRKRFAQLAVDPVNFKDLMLTLALLTSAVTKSAFENMQTRFRSGE